jgi:hypothetical protein
VIVIIRGDVEGLAGINNRQCDILNSADRNFFKHTSKATFGWYICQHLFTKCLATEAHQTVNAYTRTRFFEYIMSQNYPVPLETEEYLRSIGNTNDRAETEYQIVLPARLNEEGHFGRVAKAKRT